MTEDVTSRSDMPFESITAAIGRALGVKHAAFTPFTAGVSRRTFLVRHMRRRWVARIEQAPAEELRRAVAAQQMARAAGVRAPMILAHNLEEGSAERYGWTVEEYVAGAAFDHHSFEQRNTRMAAVDLGRQLRLLHAVELDAFGALPPRPYEVYATHQDWIANQRRRVAEALRLSGANLGYTRTIDEAYTMLAETYTAGPRLIKSDCVGDNLLVADGKIRALIDWEWASGVAPAFEVSYWVFRTPATEALDYLLAGYEPDDPALLRRRVMAYQALHAIDQIHVFNEYRHIMSPADFEAGINYSTAKLRTSLGARLWE